MAERGEMIRPQARWWRTNRRPRWAAVGVVLMFLAVTVATDPAMPDDTTAPLIDLYILLGRTPVWMGDRIRYTVYERTHVEARLSGVGGELIVLLDVGEQGPGQYTLPWDGTFHGSPFAGRYECELFFGDEYAARFWFLCRPLPSSP